MMKEISLGTYESGSKCDYCGGSLLLMKSGYTCSACGAVHSENYAIDGFIISQSDHYENKTAKQFVAIGKQLDNVSHLGSYIDFYKAGYFYDNKNMPLSPDKQKLFYRLKFTRDFRSRLDDNETYYRIVKIMKEVSNSLNFIPDIRKRAVYLYNKIIKASSGDSLKVPNHVSLIATSLFLSSREFSSYAPVTIQEICLAFQDLGHRVNCKMIIRDMLYFKQYVELKRLKHDGKDYLERLTNNLYHDGCFNARFKKKAGQKDVKAYVQRVKVYSMMILDGVPKKVRDSRNPFILAGAAIYGADLVYSRKHGTKRVITQKVLAGATGIAEYSIRDHYCSVIKRVVALIVKA